VLAHDHFEELARQLVVLLVRFARVDCDRAGLELRQEAHKMTLLRFFAGAAFFAQPLGEQAANAEAHHPIRQQIAGEQAERQ